jgi:hypothetical protein
MIRFKRPIEYELSPDTIEKGTHWLSVHLKNTGDDHLKNLNIKMHSLDSVHISFRNPNHYIYDLDPDEEKYLNLLYILITDSLSPTILFLLLTLCY